MNLTLTTPFAHQAKIIEATKDEQFHGLFMEQGTGKTHVIIATMVHLFRTGKINGVLVLAPNGVHSNWAINELPLHCPLIENEQMFTAIWQTTGGVAKRRRFLWTAEECPVDCLPVLLANIEAARTESFMEAIDKFVRTRKFMLVIDESTIIKNPKAQQTKSVFRISKNAAYARILTGTPITQSPLDLWAQCHVLDPLALPYPSYTSFRREFAIEETVYLGPGRPQFQKITGYRNQDKLRAMLAKFTTRILKKDCLDLPEKIYQIRYVEMTAEQQRIYKDLTKQCLALLEPGMITVTTALAMILRLHQVVLGYVKTDDGEIRPIEHNRLSVLSDLLGSSTGKTIIFCRFLEDVNRVCESLMGPYVRYTGQESSDLRTAAVKSFQEDPACLHFVATNAAARGLTLTAAENVIYYSQGFSLEDRLQSEDRAHRIGQTKHVVYTDLVARGTVDEKIILALKNKQELADSVLSRENLKALVEMTEEPDPITRTKFYQHITS